ncbi:AAA family ATP:ADP antiporter [Luteimonas cucumeris]|uniref:AAA family ATP:ADP antiporter n=1 Tax=Luteimonas cucumeris TaxID=985012 RepID=A0A562LFD2_9GAMM|nr:MFS transporter [Luteimonas cucumeris]TWI06317.1 AAA family ATP:ADP antiporter [Luteimonas cucumeris]
MNPPAHLQRLGRFRAALAASPPLWWALLYFFSLLCGYYVLRPVRDAMAASADVSAVFPQAWIAWARGAGFELKDFTLQLLFTGTFVVMLLLQPVYGALVARFPRRVFLPVVYLFFIACLIGFWWAFDRNASGRGALFFIWVAVFNLFAVTVFWSFMADVFDNEHAKQVYGYIGAGGTIGALVGPMITRYLVGPLGVANLLLVSVGFLALCLLCILKLRPWAMRREREHGEVSGEQAMGGSIIAGLKLVWQKPLLRALAMLMFFGVGVGTLLYNEQAAIARQFYPGAEASTRYFSTIDWAVNTLTILIQLFLTRWLLRRYGVAPTLMIPAIAILVGYCLLALSPLPLLVAMVQVATRAGEFSLAKPGRETLYTRVDRESRYKAKAVVDTVVYRAGDLSFVWLHKGLAAFGSSVVFTAGIGVALGFLFGAWRVIRAQRALPDEGAPGDHPTTQPPIPRRAQRA